MKELREIHLSAPVATWLSAQGYTVYTEVPFRCGYRMVDLVGLRRLPDGREEYSCVELKATLNWTVIRQGRDLQLATSQAWVAVGTAPKPAGVDACRSRGLGLLSVRGDQVTVLLEPRDTGQRFGYYREALGQSLSHMLPGGQAGRPTLKGEGPAQDVARLVAAYRKVHPETDPLTPQGALSPSKGWHELYKNVSNHYANAKSMRWSLVKRGLA